MKNMNSRLVQALLYVFAYVSIVASVIASGYILLKSENEDNKKVAKISLVVGAIFIGLTALVNFLSYILQDLAKIYVYDTLRTISGIIGILEIIVFATLVILALCGVVLSAKKVESPAEKVQVKSVAQEEQKEQPQVVETKNEETTANVQETKDNENNNSL